VILRRSICCLFYERFFFSLKAGKKARVFQEPYPAEQLAVPFLRVRVSVLLTSIRNNLLGKKL